MNTHVAEQVTTPPEIAASAGEIVSLDQPAPGALAPSASEADRFLAMIERFATDPRVDVDKLGKLLDMHERIQARNAEVAFAAAFAELQPELPTIDRKGDIVITHKDDKDKDPEQRRVIQRTKFLTIADLTETIRPILHRHGFSLSFIPGNTPEGKAVATGILQHRLGHSRVAPLSSPLDTTGSKNNLQGLGSTLTYLYRYLAIGLLSIASRDPRDGDDDAKKAGEIASGAASVTPDQIKTIHALIQETATDPAQFLEAMKLPSIEAMTVEVYKEALQLFDRKKKIAARKASAAKGE